MRSEDHESVLIVQLIDVPFGFHIGENKADLPICKPVLECWHENRFIQVTTLFYSFYEVLLGILPGFTATIKRRWEV